MKFINQKSVIFITFFTFSKSSPTSQNFIVDYFVNLKHISRLSILPCSFLTQSGPSTLNLIKDTNNHSLVWSINYGFGNVSDTIKGFYLNLSCPSSKDILKAASEQNLFTKGYQWLVEGQTNQTPFDALENVGIRADTEMTFAFNSDETIQKTLFNVYAYGKHLRKDIVVNPFGYWSQDKGFNLTFVPKLKHRNDFNATELRLMIYTNANSSANLRDISYLDKIYTSFGATFDILLQVRYFHSLNILLREKFNLKLVPKVISENIQNYDSLYGADMISAGAFLQIDTLNNFDFVFAKFRQQEDLFYLLTPELTSDRDYLTFLIPLDTPVWVIFIMFLLLLALMVKIFGEISKSNDIDVITQIVGIVTNQGVNPMPDNYSLRIIFLSGLTMMLILFNLYTASLIGVILTPLSDRFENSTQVLKSNISLARQNDYYTQQALDKSLKDASRPIDIIQHGDDGSIPQHRSWQTVTVFNDCNKGLNHTKKGMLAFVGDTPLVQSVIKKEFNPSQICDLRKQSIMNEPMYMILPKNSQYTELFRTAILKSFEAGLLDRTRQEFTTDMPVCMAGVTVYSVPLSKVRGAIFVIGVGFISSTSCFLIELVWKTLKNQLTQILNVLTKSEKHIDEKLLNDDTPTFA